MASIAYAEQEIVGAFGVRLGDTVDDSMEFVEENDLGELIYKFTPAKPNEFFAWYKVFATHKSKKVLRIYAENGYEAKVCSAKREIIKAALMKKYGRVGISGHNRITWVVCLPSGKKGIDLLSLGYQDNILREQSKLEKAEEISDSL